MSPELIGAIPFTTAEQTPESVLRVVFAGQTIVGFSASVIVMVNPHEAEFPAASEVLKVFVVMPIGNKEPEGEPEFCVTSGDPQLSVAVTE